ncbi:MAG: hypothetical protein PHF31_01065 [Methylobacter sp.]|nr:hypothetical protein [Methylobacter sp.]
MLKQLSELPHPITEGLVLFDDECEFNTLMRQGVFACTVTGVFPIIGPLKLSPAQHADFIHVLSIQISDSLEDAVSEHICNENRSNFLIQLLDVIGEDAVKEILRVN